MPTTAEQKALVACLARRSEKLARIYDGGLRVFYDDENPSRFPLAAHSMRELIEKIPLLTEGEQLPTGDGMKNRIEPVRQAFLAVRVQGFGETSPLDAVDGAVRAVLGELGRFFEWLEDYRPQAEKRTAETLTRLSGPGQALPVDISENEVAGWMEADTYFKMVAHNRQDGVNRDEFVHHMTLIEGILLHRLQPTAVEDLDALDALVREGEHGH